MKIAFLWFLTCAACLCQVTESLNRFATRKPCFGLAATSVAVVLMPFSFHNFSEREGLLIPCRILGDGPSERLMSQKEVFQCGTGQGS